MTTKIVSGGQTGVDRAALDAAAACGLRHGGWCPAGRRAEDGMIPSRYDLVETDAHEYEVRTEWNVRDSDGTLILVPHLPMTGGTLFTYEEATRLGRPVLVIDVRDDAATDRIRTWLKRSNVSILNVAGPRESSSPGIYTRAFDLLVRLFAAS